MVRTTLPKGLDETEWPLEFLVDSALDPVDGSIQMVLMDGNLTPLPQLFEFSDQFNANTNQIILSSTVV